MEELYEESICSTCDMILINQVNNRDDIKDLNLKDLFIRIGPRKDFIPRPPPVVKEVEPFDMGYDDILINQVNNEEVVIQKPLDDLFTLIGRKEDFTEQPEKIVRPWEPYLPWYAMSPNRPSRFNIGTDRVLLNEVNNVDLKIEGTLNELFSEIGPREAFVIQSIPKIDGEFPEGYAMSPNSPPPFDMGYEDILINQANNVDVKIFEDLEVLFTKIGRRRDFIEPTVKKKVKEERFDMGHKDILINEVNNRDEILKDDLCELFTKIGPRVDFILADIKKIKKIPRGYAMDPGDPPPFDMGYDDILINEANNEDLVRTGPLDELFTEIGRRSDFIKERLLRERKRPTPPPFDNGSDGIFINKVNNWDEPFNMTIEELFRSIGS